MKEDRVFKTKDKDGNEVVLKFKRPTQAVLNKAELEQRVAYSNAFTKGCLTNKQVQKLLKSRNMWTDEDDEKSRELRQKQNELSKKLEECSGELSDEEGRAICDEIKKLRDEIDEHESVITDVLENTADSISILHRNYYICAECTVYADSGVKVYKGVEDLKSRADEPMTGDAYRETSVALLELNVQRDLPSDLTEEYPENKWLKQRGLLDKSEDVGDNVDKEKKAPKKQGRAKKSAQ